MKSLVTDNLVKIYSNKRVVDSLSLAVNIGEIVGLLGPNGAGKTTTFYMIVGLIKPNRGRILADGKNITKMPVYKRARIGIGYLSQEPSVFRKLTVEQNLMAILETMPLKRDQRRERLDYLLSELKISHLKKHMAFTLSGGERRRVEIARALTTNPDFILLDEPFAGVDPIAVEDIQSIVKDLKNKGLGVIITDHNVRDTLAITDRAYIIAQGCVLKEGNAEFLANDEEARKIYLGERFKLD
jgi:lipopolysaccharide export system ATP-binding protein